MTDTNTPPTIDPRKLGKDLPPPLVTATGLHPQVKEEPPPPGAVMQLHDGAWADREAALEILKGEGLRAKKRSLDPENNEAAGAMAREAYVREVHRLLSADDMAGISQKVYGHRNAKTFKLTDCAHAPIRPIHPGEEAGDVSLDW